MEQYRYTYFDYEVPDNRSRGAYDRIMHSIYRKGHTAAAGHFATPPKNPYKRSDYADVWRLGFDTAREAIETAVNELSAEIPV